MAIKGVMHRVSHQSLNRMREGEALDLKLEL